jgi:predicted acetyltransferase
MDIQIRSAVPDEFTAAVEVMSTAFLERDDPAVIVAAFADTWEAGRTWIAWDGDRACGTFRSTGVTLTVPGGATLPAAAISGVTVLPTHRRRGILTDLVAKEHAAIVERGEAVGLLYASEYPIYGRFGYAPATTLLDHVVVPQATGVHGIATGSLELLRADEGTKAVLKALFEAWRARRAGEITRTEASWDFRLGLRDNPWDGRWKGWVLLHRDAAGVPDGYARYKADPKWEHHIAVGELVVQELIALTGEAYAGLLRFILEIDLATTVKLESRAEGEPLPWLLTNARAAMANQARDGLWVRLFDVPRALEARTYERAAVLVVEVVDAAAPGGRLRVRLDAGPDGATCRQTALSPDLTVPLAALGGAYLGGARLRDVVLATGVDEHRDGALAEAEALLRTADKPGCSTFF